MLRSASRDPLPTFAGSHTVFLYAFETVFWHLQKPSCWQPDRLLYFLYAFETAFCRLQKPETPCGAFSEPLPTYGARKPPCFLTPSLAAVSFCRVPKLLFDTFKSLNPSAAPSEIVYRPLEPVPGSAAAAPARPSM